MTQPVCLILGAGAGIGGHVAKRFAHEGHHACLARRSDKAGLDRLVAEIQVGAIEVAVFNPAAQIGDQGLADTSLKAFETGWRMATFVLFRRSGGRAVAECREDPRHFPPQRGYAAAPRGLPPAALEVQRREISIKATG